MVTGSRKNELTESQAQVLSFIRERHRDSGVPPSYREIQEHFGYKAVGTVQDHVRALREKGYLEPAGGRARGIVPVNARIEGTKRIPIYGEIAAGSLREAPQVELGSLVVADTAAKGPSFALRVVGDSMIEAGIFEGDHLIVERGSRVRHGDIVVALLNGETTVKYYERRDGQIYLVPANREMEPIPVTAGSFEIQGKVVGLQRRIG